MKRYGIKYDKEPWDKTTNTNEHRYGNFCIDVVHPVFCPFNQLIPRIRSHQFFRMVDDLHKSIRVHTDQL